MAQRLRSAPVHRNIELRQYFLGLEIVDAIALGGVGVLLFMLNGAGVLWNVVALVLLVFLVRGLKRGKPDGYLSSLVLFYLVRRPFYSAAAPDTQGAERPFPFPDRPSRIPGAARSSRQGA